MHFYILVLIFFGSGLYHIEVCAQNCPVKVGLINNNIYECGRINSKADLDIEKIITSINNGTVQDSICIACCYHQIAIEYHYKFNDDIISLRYNEKAKKIREKIQDGLLWRSNLNIGLNYYELSEYKQALKYFEKALSVSGIKETSDSIEIYIYMAHSHMENGDIETAISFGQRAISFGQRAISTKADQARINAALNVFAWMLINSEDSINLIEGVKYSREAFESGKILNNYENMGIALNNLAFANERLGNSNKALSFYDQAIDIADSITILKKATFFNNIANAYTNQKEYDLAIGKLKKSLYLYGKWYETDYTFDYSAVLENLADNYIALQQFDTALLHYQKALINLTNNFRTENIFKNPQPNDKDIFIYSNLDMIRVLHLKATAAYQYYQQNNNIKYLNLANQTYQAVFDFHDQLQQEISTENSRLFQVKNIVSYIENALKVAYELQQKGQPIGEAAFRFMEKNKSTVLLQSMNEADALKFANLPDSLLEQEKDLKIAITFHKKQLNEAMEYEETTEIERLNDFLFEEKQEYSQLIDSLETNYPDYHRLKYQQNKTQLADVQNTLDDKTALLEYFVGDSAIYILSIQKEASQLYKLPKPKDWQPILDDFRLALTDSKVLKDGIDRYKTVFVESGHQLYQWLLEQPLNDLGAQIDRLQIIPDGSLNTIPFELLLTEKVDSNSIDYRSLPYVLRNKSLGYLYAGAFLKDQKKTVSNDTLLSLAGFSANYQNTSLGALPFSKHSVLQLSKKFMGTSFTNATKQNFKDEVYKYKILLFTVHAILDDKNAMNSALIFSPTSDSLDNQLRAADLYTTTLNAEMAVLSACETGLGKINKGEGVMSLSRAFTYAGCPSLVMSLWSIPNKSTALLTESFFDNLNDGMTKDRALQQTKLAYLDTIPSRLAHPAYWAGLVATGDLSPVDMGGQSSYCLCWMIILLLFLGLASLYYYKQNKVTHQ